MAFKIKCWGVVLLAVFAAVGCSTTSQQEGPLVLGQVPAPKPIMDQRALDILKRMSDTLAQAKTRSFSVRSTAPMRGPNGMWVSLLGVSKVLSQGSDKLFVETRGDLFPFDFYFDGKAITFFAPRENVYARKDSPGTIDDMIERGFRDKESSFKYADILLTAPYPVFTTDLIQAVYVGKSEVDGVKTDHLAFVNKEVDWQIWIGVEDRLPRLIQATFFEAIGEPSYMAHFSDWKIDAPIAAEAFVFSNASRAVAIEYRNPFAQPSQPTSPETR
jgi:hypothetical protein